jgi:hypothetical protein
MMFDIRQVGTPLAALKAVGRIVGGWAYEMQLQLENGCWVVSQLRVFPDPGDLDLEQLLDDTKWWMGTGMADWAAASARELAHIAQAQPRPTTVFLPPGGLTARHLRRIKFRGLKEQHEGVRRLVNRYRGSSSRHRKGRHRGDARLALVAKLYVAALSRGSRTPIADVARQFRAKKASQVRDAIYLARRKGFLSATREQGVPGGELTPKAIELLEGTEEEVTRPSKKEPSSSKGNPSSNKTRKHRKGGNVSRHRNRP